MRRSLLALLVSLLAVVLTAPAALAACPRWGTTTVVSTQEGCGSGLTLSVRWSRVRDVITVRSVLVDNDDAVPLVPSLSVTADGVLAYAGPNGHGKVGDGKDYEWVRGYELNAAGARVPIGASDLNPLGWRPVSGKALVIRAVLGEARYCTAVLSLPTR